MIRKPRKGDFRELKSKNDFPGKHTPGSPKKLAPSIRHSFRKSVSIYPRSCLNQSLPPPPPSPRNQKFLDPPLGVLGNSLYIQFTLFTTASLQQRKPLPSCVLLAKITSPQRPFKNGRWSNWRTQLYLILPLFCWQFFLTILFLYCRHIFTLYLIPY